MRHSYFGRKLSRTSNERQQLFRNLLRAIISHGRITTTITKAKAIQPTIEKLITKAKIGTDEKKRELFAELTDKESTQALWEMAKNRFAQRQSGYTRTIKLGTRAGDAAEMVILEFVDAPVAIVAKKEPVEKSKEPEKSKSVKKQTPRKK